MKLNNGRPVVAFFFFTWAGISYCKTTPQMATDQVVLEEGFIDDHTIIVRGEGVSAPQYRGKRLVQEFSAAEAALSDAQQKVVDICRGAMISGCGYVPPVAAELRVALRKDLRVLRKDCKLESATGDVFGCRIFYKLKLNGLRDLCRGTEAPTAGCAAAPD